jgi:hypothetical protein
MRVLPNQGPTLQLVAYQNFSDFWSCVHSSIFLLAGLAPTRFRHDSTLGAAGLRTDFPSKDGKSASRATGSDLSEPRKLCSAKRI